MYTQLMRELRLTPLHIAAAQGQTKSVREMIRRGASKSVVAGERVTPLHQAALKGHVEAAVAMLEEGCPLDIVNSAGATVLHWAAAGGHVELVRNLVDKGCDVNAVESNGCTPLHCAASCRTETVRHMIKFGATKSVVAGVYGTPLHQAILNGHLQTVESLLVDEHCELDLANQLVASSKAQVLEFSVSDIGNSLGQTPVMLAVRHGQVEVFKLLTPKSISGKDNY